MGSFDFDSSLIRGKPLLPGRSFSLIVFSDDRQKRLDLRISCTGGSGWDGGVREIAELAAPQAAIKIDYK